MKPSMIYNRKDSQRRSLSFHTFFVAAGMILLMAILAGACRKDTGQSTPIPAAGLLAFNLAPDKDALGIALSGNPLTPSPLAYTSYNGNYQNIYTGTRDIEAYDYMTDSGVATSSYKFEDGVLYSLFVVGNNGAYKNIVVKDDVDSSASPDRAYIRYINAIPDSSAPVVTIAANGNNVIDAPAGFTEVSSFTAVDGGDVTIAVNNGNTIAADRTVTLENGKIYTALLIGVPDATDPDKAVQIRYIVNGMISEASGQ